MSSTEKLGSFTHMITGKKFEAFKVGDKFELYESKKKVDEVDIIELMRVWVEDVGV